MTLAAAKRKRPGHVCVTFYVMVVAEQCQQDLNPLCAAEAVLRLVPQHPDGALNAAAHQGGGVHSLLVALQGDKTANQTAALILCRFELVLLS